MKYDIIGDNWLILCSKNTSKKMGYGLSEKDYYNHPN
jgi:hypothetical protein